MSLSDTARRLVLSALALGGFTIGTTEFASMGLLPSFADDFHISAPEASRAISSYALGVVVGAPAIAVAAARVERGPLLIGLMLFYAVCNLAAALAPSFASFTFFRFLNGLPHGAYFGVAALVAASVAPPDKRAQAIAGMFLGLTVATVVGVPLATAMGQHFGWRSAFLLTAALALLTALSVLVVRPPDTDSHTRSPLAELGALARLQVWLSLGIGAVGFGGMFAVYTYVGPVLVHVTHVSPRMEPWALALFGIGLTLGNLLAARGADRAIMPTAAIILIFSGIADAVYAATASSLALLMVATFLVGAGGGLGTVIQARLMNVAGDAQTLAASLMHSAFNFANAVGPAVGALAIAHGFGWRSTGVVGVFFSLGGLMVWAASVAVERRRATATEAAWTR